MKFNYNDNEYNINIIRKKTNRNTYIRVKDDLEIQVTTNTITSEKFIEKLINENYKAVTKMIDSKVTKNKNNEGFNYLGKKYDIIYTSSYDFLLGDNKVFMNKNIDIDKWYKKQAKEIFKEHLDTMYKKFTKNIPYPTLKIRKMTTRWGVCNTRSKMITLNLELIKRDTKYLDYVIVHELSHLIHPNHSKDFWSLVEENISDYKKYRKEMKEF